MFVIANAQPLTPTKTEDLSSPSPRQTPPSSRFILPPSPSSAPHLAVATKKESGWISPEKKLTMEREKELSALREREKKKVQRFQEKVKNELWQLR